MEEVVKALEILENRRPTTPGLGAAIFMLKMYVAEEKEREKRDGKWTATKTVDGGSFNIFKDEVYQYRIIHDNRHGQIDRLIAILNKEGGDQTKK